MNNLEKNVNEKLKNNVALTTILIELNKDPIKAVEALRELNQDKTLFSNYEAMLSGSERSIAISNILHIITEQIDANNESLASMVDTDLGDIKNSIKDRFVVKKITSISRNLDTLLKTLDLPNTTNMLNNMYKLDKVNLLAIESWFKLNTDKIEDILDYDIETFINELGAITNSYTEQALGIVEAGDELVIDFSSSDRVLFNLQSTNVKNDNVSNTIEAINYLIDYCRGLETRLEVNTKILLSSITNFKPSKIALTKTLKVSKQIVADYNENKITSEALEDLTMKYNNVIKTYFSIFTLRLNTLSSYTEVMEDIITNHNRVILDIEYLQNSFK